MARLRNTLTGVVVNVPEDELPGYEPAGDADGKPAGKAKPADKPAADKPAT